MKWFQQTGTGRRWSQKRRYNEHNGGHSLRIKSLRLLVLIDKDKQHNEIIHDGTKADLGTTGCISGRRGLGSCQKHTASQTYHLIPAGRSRRSHERTVFPRHRCSS